MMRLVSSSLFNAGAAVGLVISGLAAIPHVASAQTWYNGDHYVTRCDSDGDRCATFRCDGDGDACDRISPWRRRWSSGYSIRPYWHTETRCDSDGDRCATFRCDSDGDRCNRVSRWWRND